MGALPYPGIPTNAILKLLKSGYRMERPISCSVELYVQFSLVFSFKTKTDSIFSFNLCINFNKEKKFDTTYSYNLKKKRGKGLTQFNIVRDRYNIMFSCWTVRPQSRPTFTQLKESLDKLLCHHSGNKYLNMDEILYDGQEQHHESDNNHS